jgi:hypothetical protein
MLIGHMRTLRNLVEGNSMAQLPHVKAKYQSCNDFLKEISLLLL